MVNAMEDVLNRLFPNSAQEVPYGYWGAMVDNFGRHIVEFQQSYNVIYVEREGVPTEWRRGKFGTVLINKAITEVADEKGEVASM